MKSKKDIVEQVIHQAQKIEIPDSLQPENIQKKLEKSFEGEVGRKAGEPVLPTEKAREKLASVNKSQRNRMQKFLITAASLLFLLGSFSLIERLGILSGNKAAVWEENREAAAPEAEAEVGVKADTTIDVAAGQVYGPDFGEATYEEIYASMLSEWEREYSYSTRGEPMDGGTIPESGVVEAAEESSALDTGDGVNNGVLSSGSTAQNIQGKSVAIALSEREMQTAVEDLTEDTFGATNIQTVGVDEGDIIKNDGRYLYQIVQRATNNGYQQAIQIVDTKDGLRQVVCLGGFDNIQEFYVRDDRLIVIECNKYGYTAEVSSSPRYSYDVAYRGNAYHEIFFYDISKKEEPHFIKSFTLTGEYTSSRVSEGYFYGFSRFYANPGEGEEDYAAYVPKVGERYLTDEQILLPKDSKGTSYLVLVSVELENPEEFVETKAVVSTGDMYYVSGENIYVTSFHSAKEQEGWNSTATDILKFAYQEGKFSLAGRGTIKGQLESSFSLDEYNGYLRAVSTVREYYYKMLEDDRTGEHIGYEILQEKETNSLYVLDEQLKVTGSIEGLARNEQIYSARFFGEVGYFVTFRRTDPLYAVDLSNPAKPEILSELKVSGFSEYLHLYGTDRLLGIGMEADEDTGIQEGMKLSMFDISDPADVQEVTKLNLSEYDYSEALYNHKAVLIHSEANIIGFEAEGHGNRYRRKYLIFSYDREKDIFVQEMELNAMDVNGNFCQTRGTFIGNTFYLLCSDGSITSYDRSSGKKIEVLKFMDE